MQVKILSGGYGLPYTYKTKHGTQHGTRLILRGQTVELPEQEAQRLIALGHAAAVADMPVPAAEAPDPDNGQDNTTGSDGIDTPDPDKEQETEDEIPAADVGCVEPEDEVDLSSLTVQELKALCAEAGIDLKGLNSKAKLIAAYETLSLPELGAEEPV